MRISVSAGGGNDLVEGFFCAYQSQVGSSPLFGGLGALLEIDDLGVQRRVPVAKRRVLDSLIDNGGTQEAGLRKTRVRKPQLALQRECNDSQQHEQPATVIQSAPRNRPGLYYGTSTENAARPA